MRRLELKVDHRENPQSDKSLDCRSSQKLISYVLKPEFLETPNRSRMSPPGERANDEGVVTTSEAIRVIPGTRAEHTRVSDKLHIAIILIVTASAAM